MVSGARLSWSRWASINRVRRSAQKGLTDFTSLAPEDPMVRAFPTSGHEDTPRQICTFPSQFGSVIDSSPPLPLSRMLAAWVPPAPSPSSHPQGSWFCMGRGTTGCLPRKAPLPPPPSNPPPASQPLPPLLLPHPRQSTVQPALDPILRDMGMDIIPV